MIWFKFTLRPHLIIGREVAGAGSWEKDTFQTGNKLENEILKLETHEATDDRSLGSTECVSCAAWSSQSFACFQTLPFVCVQFQNRLNRTPMQIWFYNVLYNQRHTFWLKRPHNVSLPLSSDSWHIYLNRLLIFLLQIFGFVGVSRNIFT